MAVLNALTFSRKSVAMLRHLLPGIGKAECGAVFARRTVGMKLAAAESADVGVTGRLTLFGVCRPPGGTADIRAELLLPLFGGMGQCFAALQAESTYIGTYRMRLAVGFYRVGIQPGQGSDPLISESLFLQNIDFHAFVICHFTDTSFHYPMNISEVFCKKRAKK